MKGNYLGRPLSPFDVEFPNPMKLLIAPALVLLTAHSAHSAAITWNFAGQLTTVADYGRFQGLFSPGTPYSGSFVYDSAAPLLADYGGIRYFDPTTLSLQFTMGSSQFSSTTGGVFAFEDDGDLYFDSPAAGPPSLSGPFRVVINLRLIPRDPLNLPTTLASAQMNSLTRVILTSPSAGNPTSHAFGPLTSLQPAPAVPEPASAALLSVALAGLAWRARMRPGPPLPRRMAGLLTLVISLALPASSGMITWTIQGVLGDPDDPLTIADWGYTEYGDPFTLMLTYDPSTPPLPSAPPPGRTSFAYRDPSFSMQLLLGGHTFVSRPVVPTDVGNIGISNTSGNAIFSGGGWFPSLDTEHPAEFGGSIQLEFGSSLVPILAEVDPRAAQGPNSIRLQLASQRGSPDFLFGVGHSVVVTRSDSATPEPATLGTTLVALAASAALIHRRLSPPA